MTPEEITEELAFVRKINAMAGHHLTDDMLNNLKAHLENNDNLESIDQKTIDALRAHYGK